MMWGLWVVAGLWIAVVWVAIEVARENGRGEKGFLCNWCGRTFWNEEMAEKHEVECGEKSKRWFEG